MRHVRTYYPSECRRPAPDRIAVYTRVAVNDDDPRVHTRQIVQSLVLELKDNGYLERLRERCRWAELYDYYECEVSLP